MTAAPLPPLELLRAGQRVPVAWGHSTVLPDLDMETFSEAGFLWDEAGRKWQAPPGATKKGLPAVGSAVYAEHPTAEVLCLAYDLKRGEGRKRWRQGDPLPLDLLQYLAAFDPNEPPSYHQAGLIEAHNSAFEVRNWLRVLHERFGWPAIDPRQFRCSMAKARAFAMPAALGNLAQVLGSTPKNKAGDALIKLFSYPRNPTKTKPATRVLPADEPAKFEDFVQYNIDDIVAESDASRRLPDLIPIELDYWLADQACNWRGVGVDVAAVHDCIAVLEQAHAKYNAELYAITGGQVARASEAAKLTKWVYDSCGLSMPSMDSDAVEAALARLYARLEAGGNDGADIIELGPVIRALEIRALIGSASVKKVYAMARMATRDGRLCDLFNYHGARTGRDTHADVQPGNLPKAGPPLRWCGDVDCQRPYAKALCACPWCGADAAFSTPGKWKADAVDSVLHIMAHRDLALVEYFFGEAILSICGCIRGLLVAAPGHDLVCSDYSSIEAVVAAVLAGEQWRIDAFHRKEDIYLRGASAITGISYEQYKAHAAEHGEHHADRQKIGKVSELALTFMGWLGAWRNFDSTDAFTDDEVKALILKWRDASPAIVEFAGGQLRGTPWRPDRVEYFGLEGAFILAVQNPGEVFDVRGNLFQVLDDALFITLLSGRRLTYHQPRIEARVRREGWAPQFELTYMTWNSNPSMGPMGWTRTSTYSGKLIENVTQATARDIMSAAVVRLERAGYPVVMRVHDEIVSEVPEGYGSEEEFERLMAELPEWAAGWPVRCGGTYRAKRYRKD